jgi:hypothetical protein
VRLLGKGRAPSCLNIVLFKYIVPMSVNIIVKGGKRKDSSEEVARHLAGETDKAMDRDKAGYMDRQLNAREAARSQSQNGDLRPTGVIDMKTYMRHEQMRPGCMTDSTYRKEFYRDNPECRV